MERRGRATTGIILIVVGILALLANLGFGEVFAEAIPALIGVVFLAFYAVGRAEWALYPGSFITPVGVVVFLAARGANMDRWWPLFVAAPGLSFLIIRLAKPSNGWAIYPAAVLLVLSGVFLTLSSEPFRWVYDTLMSKGWPVLLILLGIVIILRSYRMGRSGGAPGAC